MSLFKRSIVAEILSHSGVVFSTLLIIWLSVLLVRLLGQAAQGLIGADIVLAIVAFSSVTALPTILSVSLFISVLITISRNYRESEMVVWFTCGQSLLNWLRPVLTVALPVCLLIAMLTISSSPWAYRQIEEYRQRYEQRSDFAKVATGQFIETQGGDRIFFIENSNDPAAPLGRVFARVNEKGNQILLMAKSANLRITPEGERYIDLAAGHRYDLQQGTPEFKIGSFESYTVHVANNSTATQDSIQKLANEKLKARSILSLISDENVKSDAQIMWRISLPIAALNLAILAIPLGAVNPRLGRSSNLLIAGLIALLYMNLLNLMRGWIGNGQIGFLMGTVSLNLIVTLISVYFFRVRIRVKRPKEPQEILST